MDVAKIINHYYNLTYADTGNITLVCPFHEDENASLSINLKAGLLYCFGCGWKGDIIDFIAKREGINRLQAMQRASKLGNGLTQILSHPAKTVSSKQLLKEAYKEYQRGYDIDWRHDNYLLSRGLRPELLRQVGAKYYLNENYAYAIPIRDKGRFAGFVKTGENQTPKYMYSRGFKRGQILWGNYNPGIVFVTEGVIDYLKALQFGQTNAVCLLGWKASKTQIDKIKSVTDKIVCALDNDDKGKEGVKCLSKYFNLVEFPYPEGVKDIGEMNQKMFDDSLDRIGLSIYSKEEFNK